MGWKTWKERGRHLFQSPILKEPFYIIILSLLSLIFPLAFLLLARLANAFYILSFTSPPPSTLFPLSSLLYINTKLLHLLVSVISITALLWSLLGPTTTLVFKAHFYTAWAFLCTFHVCVVLGIQGSLAAGLWTVDLGVIDSRNLMSPVVFFIGLHETMFHWSRAIVRPVVDNTMFGVLREERWVERVAMAASFGGLWWWGLKTKVEALVVILELKRDLLMHVELADLINCWLYYLTVMIALVRLAWGLLRLANLMFCPGLPRSSFHSSIGSGGDDDGKV
ncbi:hypothetical protein NE237_014403 [Protea cynaroides]|uniref:Transmembrane protein n=1 Tax=Protea cynaroides TaxID=273540 RepID=A0A9Q0KC18_9MAGN|nr:hypothetical protein NE237_014403 [Protea cynaroides]